LYFVPVRESCPVSLCVAWTLHPESGRTEVLVQRDEPEESGPYLPFGKAGKHQTSDSSCLAVVGFCTYLIFS
jgi:hypothetical protein